MTIASDLSVMRLDELVAGLSGLLFNRLSSLRPVYSQDIALEEELERNGGEPFDDPYSLTPEDTFAS